MCPEFRMMLPEILLNSGKFRMDLPEFRKMHLEFRITIKKLPLKSHEVACTHELGCIIQVMEGIYNELSQVNGDVS